MLRSPNTAMTTKPAMIAPCSASPNDALAPRESPRARSVEISESVVAVRAEKRLEAAPKRRLAGPSAASSSTLPHLPMQTVSMRDMTGSARGRMRVGSAKRKRSPALGHCVAASASAASVEAVTAAAAAAARTGLPARVGGAWAGGALTTEFGRCLRARGCALSCCQQCGARRWHRQECSWLSGCRLIAPYSVGHTTHRVPPSDACWEVSGPIGGAAQHQSYS